MLTQLVILNHIWLALLATRSSLPNWMMMALDFMGGTLYFWLADLWADQCTNHSDNSRSCKLKLLEA